LAPIVGCAWMLGSTALQAQEAGTGCTRVTVMEAPDLAAPWHDAALALREQLGSLEPTECIALVLEISMDAGGGKVLAVRPDGLRAERRVSRPSSLSAIVLGLVASFPTSSETDAALRDASDGGFAEFDAAAEVSVLAPPLGSAEPAPQVLLDVGLSGGARFAAPTQFVMVDTELRIDVLVRRWLLIGAFRYAPTGLSVGTSDIAYEEFSLALGVGRRVALGPAALDLAISPTIAFVAMDNDTLVGSGTQFRLGTSARLFVPIGAAIGVGLTLDGELVPNHLAKPLRVDPGLPPLPSWTLGARLGIVGQFL
jgi:hypothetical protein